jgi:hypothetical protein
MTTHASRVRRGPAPPTPGSARALAGPPAEHLDPPAGLPQGPLDQVGVADPLPALTRQGQERGELGQALQQPGDRRRVALAGAVANASARRRAASTASWPGSAVRSSTICQNAALTSSRAWWGPWPGACGRGAPASAAAATASTPLDRADEPGCAVADHQQRRPQAAGDQFAEEAGPGSWPWWAPGASPTSTGLP